MDTSVSVSATKVPLTAPEKRAVQLLARRDRRSVANWFRHRLLQDLEQQLGPDWRDHIDELAAREGLATEEDRRAR